MRGALLRGGAPFYGVDIGILVLDATFPRPPGDVGHAATFPFPVLYEVVPEASPRRVVEDAAQGLLVLDPFMRAARRLVAHGVRGVATSCGFLAIYQRELAAAVPVPVATSSLLQIPLILRTLPPDHTIGVLTINGETLSERHLAGVGITAQERERLRIFGLERTEHLYPLIIGGEQELMSPVGRLSWCGRHRRRSRSSRTSQPSSWSAPICRPTLRPCRLRRSAQSTMPSH